MNIETLVIDYGLICISLIVFNIVCIFFFQFRDFLTEFLSSFLKARIKRNILSNKEYTDKEFRRLHRLYSSSTWYIALSNALNELSKWDEDKTLSYIEEISPLILELSIEATLKKPYHGLYILHMWDKYDLLELFDERVSLDLLKNYLHMDGLLYRVTAFRILCHAGRIELINFALREMELTQKYITEKLLVQLLGEYRGDKDKLILNLHEQFDSLSSTSKIAITRFSAQSSPVDPEFYLRCIKNEGYEPEIRYAAMGYFVKYRYEPVLSQLYEFLLSKDHDYWIFASLAAKALKFYPGDATILILKKALSNSNWYIRFNAANTLENIGVNEDNLDVLLDLDDAFAEDMIAYRIGHNNIYKELSA